MDHNDLGGFFRRERAAKRAEAKGYQAVKLHFSAAERLAAAGDLDGADREYRAAFDAGATMHDRDVNCSDELVRKLRAHHKARGG